MSENKQSKKECVLKFKRQDDPSGIQASMGIQQRARFETFLV